MAKPFLRWAGGKGGLLPQILPRVPKKFNSYFEPFLGGGALFFKLAPKRVYLSDINWDLLNLYNVVRDHTEMLMINMQKYENTSECYYKTRDLDRKPDYFDEVVCFGNVLRASRFLFLNKTCWNGLYRVNSKNQFNVPFGNRTAVNMVDLDTLSDASEVLKGTDIVLSSFELTMSVAVKNDFVYFDPPYVPLNETSFTSYTEEDFNLKQHERLKAVCDALTKKEVHVMLSNSHTPFVLELYDGYYINEIMAPRYVNSKGDDRGKIKEVLITNYPTKEELTLFDFI